MRKAIALSQAHMDANEGGPFGAVIVKEGQVIAEGWNQVTSTNDPTAHAEVQAIRKASAALKNFDLAGCTLYTSCEPCPMCLSAAYWARVDRIVYANSRQDAARAGFDDDFIYREVATPLTQRQIPIHQVLASEAHVAFENWLKKADRKEY